MMRDYLNEEERYRKCFAGGWYLTGDLAMRDAEGYYWFVGRSDDVIKSAGHLIGPFEVESALMEHPAVAEAGVIGKPDPVSGETVKALIVLRDPAQTSLTPADVIAWMREQVAAYKVPRRVEFVDSLPKSPVGKILWRELQDAERQPVADSSVSSAT